MARLSKDDLAQMNRGYFQSLSKERLVEVANNLHQLAIEQWEKINSNSRNSSQPPSNDNPFQKPAGSLTSIPDSSQDQSDSNSSANKSISQGKQARESKPRRNPGRQKGSKGFGRRKPLSISSLIPHYPKQCSACKRDLSTIEPKPYMGHHVLELETTESGLKVVCQLHHYYQGSCIGVRYRLSRVKIREFLADWLGVDLSVGTIDRCIREAGIACEPVVEELIAQLQQASILHLDETPWYQKGKLYWLWVAIESKTAVFRIAPRTKEELKHLVKETFVGWLITDGYGAYRHRERRQRCLAHLVRKAVGISESINSRTARIGSLILEDLRDFIRAISQSQTKKELDKIIRSLQEDTVSEVASET